MEADPSSSSLSTAAAAAAPASSVRDAISKMLSDDAKAVRIIEHKLEHQIEEFEHTPHATAFFLTTMTMTIQFVFFFGLLGVWLFFYGGYDYVCEVLDVESDEQREARMKRLGLEKQRLGLEKLKTRYAALQRLHRRMGVVDEEAAPLLEEEEGVEQAERPSPRGSAWASAWSAALRVLGAARSTAHHFVLTLRRRAVGRRRVRTGALVDEHIKQV